MIAMPSTTCTEPTITSGFSDLILVREEETSDVPLGKSSVATTLNPRRFASAEPASATVLENPSSAERNATVLGFGLASSAIAWIMDAA